MFGQIQMRNSLISLNNVAVEYFGLGLTGLSYQIWDGLYHEIQSHPGNAEELLPVISCNIGNVLRQNGFYEEAYQFCSQGLKCCFEKGVTYAVPELMLQLATLCMKLGETEKAKWLYLFGSHTFCWSRQDSIDETMEEMMERNFLLYCKEEI